MYFTAMCCVLYEASAAFSQCSDVLYKHSVAPSKQCNETSDVRSACTSAYLDGYSHDGLDELHLRAKCNRRTPCAKAVWSMF